MVSMLYRRFLFLFFPLARPFDFRQVSRQMKRTILWGRGEMRTF